MIKFYTTRNSSIWYLQDARFYYAPTAKIFNLEWDTQGTIGRCQYCGHDYAGEECPGCASRRKVGETITGIVIATLQAFANPENSWVMALPRKIQIHYLECGRSDIYNNWDWMIDLSDCETISKQIINPSSNRNDEIILFDVKFKGTAIIRYQPEPIA